MVNGSTGKDSGVTARVLQYITSRPGQLLYRNEIIAATGLTADQVMTTISQIKTRQPEIGECIEIINRGQIWRYMPNKHPAGSAAKRIFEELATTKNGDLVIQDQDGNLYRAVEL